MKLSSWTSLLFVLVISLPAHSQEQSSTAAREFVMSATYGVLAGTLVGAASLAFTDQPGENLQRVARGASLGLYLGIALGAYVVYGVPDEPSDADIYQQPGYPGLEGGAPLPPPEVRAPKVPAVQVFPLITHRGVEGAAANIRLLSF